MPFPLAFSDSINPDQIYIHYKTIIQNAQKEQKRAKNLQLLELRISLVVTLTVSALAPIEYNKQAHQGSKGSRKLLLRHNTALMPCNPKELGMVQALYKLQCHGSQRGVLI